MYVLVLAIGLCSEVNNLKGCDPDPSWSPAMISYDMMLIPVLSIQYY